MKKRPASEDAEESEAKRQKKLVSLKRPSPEGANQSVAKCQKTNTEKADQDIATSKSASMADDLVVAKRKSKTVSFAPDTKDISDEEPSPRSKKTYGRSRQNFFDYISGVPPDPAPAKGRAKRIATRAPGRTNRSSSHAATTRSEPANDLRTATPASLAAENISTIDFGYSRGGAAVVRSLSPSTGDESVVSIVEESTAHPEKITSLHDSEELQTTTYGGPSSAPYKTVHPPPGRSHAPASDKVNGAQPEDVGKPSRDGPSNEEMKQSPAPHKRVAQLRDSEKPTGVKKKKKTAKARDKRHNPSTPPSRRRYGLRSARKMTNNVNEPEEAIESTK